MRGVAAAHGAITFVNALPTGVGAAAGVALPVRATVELARSTNEERTYSLGSASPLVVSCVEAALRRYAGPGPWAVRTTVRSSVPPARGLKSSSAVSSAILRAVARAAGADPAPTEIARFSADVSQAIGLSATGAYDDALAGLVPGIHVTENASRRELSWSPPPWSADVVLWIPRRAHLPSAGLLARFRARREEGEVAVRAVRDRRWGEAMAENSRLVESVMGYEYAPLHDSLSRTGALGAGVSGMGPTVAVITPPDGLAAVLRGLPPGAGDVVVTKFTGAAGPGPEGA